MITVIVTNPNKTFEISEEIIGAYLKASGFPIPREGITTNQQVAKNIAIYQLLHDDTNLKLEDIIIDDNNVY